MQVETQALEGGFADPPRQAAQAFRGIMEAMARPGTLHVLRGARPPAPLSPAAGAVLLTLCDIDAPLYLAGQADCEAVRDWVAFHTNAPLVDRAECMFAVGSWSALQPLDDYPAGTPEYPDRSATLIVDMPELEAHGTTLQGSGIREMAALSLPNVLAFRDNARRFPLGLDFFFTCGDQVAALPRSTEVL